MITPPRLDPRTLIAALALVLLLGLTAPLPAQLGGMGGMGGMGSNLPGPMGNNQPKRYRPAQVYGADGGPVVAEIRVVGNRQISTPTVMRQLVTKPGRPLDPEALQNDVRTLIRSGMFEMVTPHEEHTQRGVVVTFEVRERPLIREIRFEGNDRISAKKLLKKCELRVASALTPYRLEEARRRLQDLYLEAGYAHAQVEVVDGPHQANGIVLFKIVEGPKQRIWWVEFVGNNPELVSDARLRTLIQSKSAIPWWFKSNLDLEQLENDRQVLTDYYRRLGYFMARVSREIRASDDGSWSKVVFVIDEGPRYRIRDVVIMGNAIYTTPDLQSLMTLKRGDHFDRTKMENDLRELRDTYGSQGYMMADIQADIQFLEEPGELDLVYTISEGDPYYVRDIKVNIRGDNPHTRHSAIMNYLSIYPMDIVDIREIRDSKRRLGASQIVETNPALGPPPDIRVVPSELSGYEMANQATTDDVGSGNR